MRSLCPVCGRAGCTEHARAADRRARKPRTREQDRERERSAKYRAKYRSPDYKRARQRAIRRYGGKCAICGAEAFRRNAKGVWVQLIPGAGVHHPTKLSEGGSAAQDGMIPVCPACHAELDRKGRGRGPRAERRVK